MYLASDGRLGRKVALKALAPHLTRIPAHRARLRREARIAAGLTHPGICAVHALEDIGDRLFIVTEFVDGVTLREEIVSGRRPSAETLTRTARDVAAALAAAHARGVTHRDVKPENIMRTPDGGLKILDFGLAHVEDPPGASISVTAVGVLIGTPAYMAPEQLHGVPADARADVFAYGVLLYEYACGVHPFAAGTPLATLARLLESDARPLEIAAPYVPRAIVDIIERCLRKAPNERFGSAADIVAVLDGGTPLTTSSTLRTSWRVHQLVALFLYFVSAVVAWQIKEWIEMSATVLVFMALGLAGTIGGVLRGHLLFTERVNPGNLRVERRRARRLLLAVDVVAAAGLALDAVLLTRWPLTAVLAMALAAGLTLRTFVLEPAAAQAAFGDA